MAIPLYKCIFFLYMVLRRQKLLNSEWFAKNAKKGKSFLTPEATAAATFPHFIVSNCKKFYSIFT